MYAVLAAAIIGSLFWSPADRSYHGDRWLASGGQSLHHRGDAGHQGILTLEYRPDWPAPLVGPRSDLKPVLGLGVSPDQTRYLYAGWRKELRWGALQITPSFSPTLFQPFGQDDPHARLQFRTGLEVTGWRLGDVELGAGYFHISNGNLNARNANIDAVFLSLRGRS